MRKRKRFRAHGSWMVKPTEGPLSQRSLWELTLFSTSVFIFAALLMQFVLTLFTAFLLIVFSITFQYRLFAINFLSQSSSVWSEERIYFVFGSGPLLISVVGLILLYVLKTHKKTAWKTRLFLTWMAFLMVNALPCGIVAGIFFYDSFGMAFHWMIHSYVIRGIIALVVLLILMFFSRIWLRLFMKTSYTTAFLKDVDSKKTFIKTIYFRPWFFGIIILFIYNLPFSSFYWPAFLLTLGYLALPAFNSSYFFLNVRITQSEKKIFTSRYQPLIVFIVLVILWIAGSFRIHF